MNRITLTATLIKLGNDYGFIIPNDVVRKMNLKEGETVKVTLFKKGKNLNFTK